MNTLLPCAAALVLFSLLPSAQLAPAQDKPGTASPAPSNFPAEYPTDGVSVLVENSSWLPLSQESSPKPRFRRGLIGSLTYGAVAAVVIIEYRGQHAELQIETRRPVFSICNVPSFPGAPALVKLHPKRIRVNSTAAGCPPWALRSPRPSGLIRFPQKRHSRKMLVGSCARAKTSRPVSML